MPAKRMFAHSVIETDDFLSLGHGSQVLYFHLCMNCDDAGFFNNSISIMKLSNCVPDDFRALVQHGYIEQYENNLFFIKHWRINNNLKQYQIRNRISDDAFSHMKLDGNKAYIKCDEIVCLPESTESENVKETIFQDNKPSMNELIVFCRERGYQKPIAEKFCSYCEKYEWKLTTDWKIVFMRWIKKFDENEILRLNREYIIESLKTNE